MRKKPIRQRSGFLYNLNISAFTAIAVLYKMLTYTLALIFAIISVVKSYQMYSVPQPEIIVYKPRGFSVSIPHTPGIEVFAFHGNINKPLPDLHAGDFSIDIRKHENGKWTFHDARSRVKIGDVIYYWLFVIKDGLGYRLDGGRFHVKEYDQTTLQFSTPIPVEEERLSRDTSACLESILNLTHTLIQQQTQITNLETRNQQMRNYIEQLPNSKKLTVKGKIPPDGLPSGSVSFVLRERLDLNPIIVSAERNLDGSITFEVPSLEDKLDIIQAAKAKLKNTRIVIQ